VSAKGETTRERIVAAAEALILAKGYAGTTLDDVLAATGLTKGAFFHHFKGKADLARAVVERYAEGDFELFRSWSGRADRLSDDPLERVLIFLKLFEEYLDGLGKPFPGCVFASYTYESRQFGPDVHDYIRSRLRSWIGLYEEKLAALIGARPAVRAVSARSLAEMIATIVEGGFVMANAMGDATWLQGQCAEYRRYLQLLFAEEEAVTARARTPARGKGTGRRSPPAAPASCPQGSVAPGPSGARSWDRRPARGRP
jgi:TetR/AcrR family transcriptional repressor of nem operon